VTQDTEGAKHQDKECNNWKIKTPCFNVYLILLTTGLSSINHLNHSF